MTKNFAHRVVWERIVDTKKYRYIFEDNPCRGTREIKRLPLSALDATGAIGGWETVKVIK